MPITGALFDQEDGRLAGIVQTLQQPVKWSMMTGAAVNMFADRQRFDLDQGNAPIDDANGTGDPNEANIARR